jgi:hypothetical protein
MKLHAMVKIEQELREQEECERIEQRRIEKEFIPLETLDSLNMNWA